MYHLQISLGESVTAERADIGQYTVDDKEYYEKRSYPGYAGAGARRVPEFSV